MIELDVQLRRGEFFLKLQTTLPAISTGILGPSGCGKSSLLLALAGLVPAEQLLLRIDGETLVDTQNKRCPPAHRRNIGLVFQDHRLFPHLSIAANLRYGLDPHQKDELGFDDVVRMLEIGDLLARRPNQCSGGQRQRVALGRALLSNPRLLLLDEPLSNLDSHLKRAILPFLTRIRHETGIPLLMVSHDLGEVLSLTDELLLLHHGRMLGQGSVIELAKTPAAYKTLRQDGLWFPQSGRFLGNENGSSRIALDGDSDRHVYAPLLDNVHRETSVTLFLRPDDIALALPSEFRGASTLSNRLAAKITDVQTDEDHALLTLDAGTSHPFLADITPHALQTWDLHPGQDILMLFKARAPRIRLL